MSQPQPLLEVKDLKKHYPIRKGLFGRVSGQVHAVDAISDAAKQRASLVNT